MGCRNTWYMKGCTARDLSIHIWTYERIRSTGFRNNENSVHVAEQGTRNGSWMKLGLCTVFWYVCKSLDNERMVFSQSCSIAG